RPRRPRRRARALRRGRRALDHAADERGLGREARLRAVSAHDLRARPPAGHVPRARKAAPRRARSSGGGAWPRKGRDPGDLRRFEAGGLKKEGRSADPSIEPMDLNGVLLRAVELGSTDVHLKYGQPPVCRIDGDLTPMADARPLDESALISVLETIGRRAPE